MPQAPNLLKAELRQIDLDTKQEIKKEGKKIIVPVQFNPQTLKVSFSNQKSGGDQKGGSAIQFVGRGTTKLSLELWFDVTVPLSNGKMQEKGDVRRLTKKIAHFIAPIPAEKKDKKGKNKFVPPGVRFIWGSFLFDGVMDSMEENLEYFSEDGKPLRARVSVSFSRQEIQFEFGNQQPPGSGTKNPPGTQPMHMAKSGDTVQKMAAQTGQAQDWQSIAAANNIESPRHLKPGTPLNLSDLHNKKGAL